MKWSAQYIQLLVKDAAKMAFLRQSCWSIRIPLLETVMVYRGLVHSHRLAAQRLRMKASRMKKVKVKIKMAPRLPVPTTRRESFVDKETQTTVPQHFS